MYKLYRAQNAKMRSSSSASFSLIMSNTTDRSIQVRAARGESFRRSSEGMPIVGDHETALPEIIRLANVPILERDRSAVSHPEKSALVGLVSAGRPKVLVTKPEVLDVLLEPVVFLLRGYTRQMHSMITAILRGSVPVRL